MRFQSRVSLTVVTVLNVALGVTLFAYAHVIPRALRDSFQRDRWDTAARFEARLRSHLTPTLDYASIERFWLDYRDYHPADSLLLVRDDGKVIAAFGHEWDTVDFTVDTTPLRQFITDTSRSPVQLEARTILGEVKQHSFSAVATAIGEHPGYFVFLLGIGTAPYATQVAVEDAGMITALLLTVLVAATGSACALYLLHGMFRRLHNLQDGVRAFSETNRPLTLDTSGEDELSELSTALNGMSGTIAGLLAELRDRDSRRRELIACTWHDIRSPLTALRGAIELSGGAPDEQAQLEQSLKQSTRMLTEIVDQLYDLSKLESAELEPKMGPVDLAETVDTVLVTARPLAQEHGVTLTAVIDDGAYMTIADPVLLFRAIRNLLDNAIRHSSRGGEVSIRLAETEDHLVIEVLDDGEGIDEALLPVLFEPYQSGSRPGLLGLGLAIVSRIVKLHGGASQVLNRSEGGAHFRITIPRVQPAGGPAAGAPSEAA